MTDTPKDGDLGSTVGQILFLRYSEGDWRHPDGDAVTTSFIPTGERAVPIDVCKTVAEWLREHPERELMREFGEWADILDPPTPEPEPRFRENDVVVYGDAPTYIVNAEGVPCMDGRPTRHPLDSDLWRVVGTFTPLPDPEFQARLDAYCPACEGHGTNRHECSEGDA